MEHFTIYHNPAHYSAHPRQCPFKYLGNDEVILGFTRATTVQGGDVTYQDENDVRHGFYKGGYKSRGEILIRRSTDGGRTWPEENDVVVYEHRMPMDQKRAFIFQEGVDRIKSKTIALGDLANQLTDKQLLADLYVLSRESPLVGAG